VLRETLSQPQPQASAPRASQLRPKLHELALVHWQAPDQPPLEVVSGYLRQKWELEPEALQVMEESWFRDGGAWVKVTLQGADPVPVEVDPETTP
jgi:hypothetical protein